MTCMGFCAAFYGRMIFDSPSAASRGGFFVSGHLSCNIQARFSQPSHWGGILKADKLREAPKRKEDAEMLQTVFERHEKKYLLSQERYQTLQERLASRVRPDEYGRYTLCTLYYDTEDYRSIRQREDKSIYREKLRMRSYGVPGADGQVFLELKKKLDGVTYKRRLPLTLAEAEAYMRDGRTPGGQSQVLGEIDWFIRQNSPKARFVVCYDRLAFAGCEDPSLRITFDSDIRYRAAGLALSKGDWGRRVLDGGEVLMEVKTPGAMPLWLAQALSGISAYPAVFSKYNCVFECAHKEEAKRCAG